MLGFAMNGCPGRPSDLMRRRSDAMQTAAADNDRAPRVDARRCCGCRVLGMSAMGGSRCRLMELRSRDICRISHRPSDRQRAASGPAARRRRMRRRFATSGAMRARLILHAGGG